MDDIRIGLIARADITGLGIQTRDFYKHMKPTKTIVVDLSRCSGKPMNRSWYPDADYIEYVPYPDTPTHRIPNAETKTAIDSMLDQVDLVFTCETPYDYYLFEEAERRGVATVLQYNFELLDHVMNPQLPQPTLFMAPSLWRYDHVPFDNKVFVPVPVDTSVFSYREPTSPVVTDWVHIGGNPAMEDRNGTNVCIEAFTHVNNAHLHIMTPARFKARSGNVTVHRGLPEEPIDLYSQGEGFLLPRKFGGLCLPLNEAMALGMPCVMTNIPPQSAFLEPEGLVSVKHTKTVFTKIDIEIFEPNVIELANIIERLAVDEDLVARMRHRAQTFTETISWANIRPIYLDIFSTLLDNKTPDQLTYWT